MLSYQSARLMQYFMYSVSAHVNSVVWLLSKILKQTSYNERMEEPVRTIYGTEVRGTKVDSQTRCAHYNSDIDIIAIKFKCCEQWFPCFECHAENTAHTPTVWSANEFDTPAVLCGGCGHQLTVAEYLECDSVCPKCRRAFNPGCTRHRHLYFESLYSDK